MNMSQSVSENPAKIIDVLVVWAPTIQEAMDKAYSLGPKGWRIEGLPRPMIHSGTHGTSVTIIKELDI